MVISDKEVADYLAGRTRLMTNGAKKTFKFVPATTRPYDKGVTSPEKRAYWRVWSLKRRFKRLGIDIPTHLDSKRTYKTTKKPVKTTNKEHRREYMMAYRARNREKLAQGAREKYHNKQKAAGFTSKSSKKHAKKGFGAAVSRFFSSFLGD